MTSTPDIKKDPNHCNICFFNIKFREFQRLLPETSQQEFQEWYSKLFDNWEAAETELAMRDYRSKQAITQQIKN